MEKQILLSENDKARLKFNGHEVVVFVEDNGLLHISSGLLHECLIIHPTSSASVNLEFKPFYRYAGSKRSGKNVE